MEHPNEWQRRIDEVVADFDAGLIDSTEARRWFDYVPPGVIDVAECEPLLNRGLINLRIAGRLSDTSFEGPMWLRQTLDGRVETYEQATRAFVTRKRRKFRRSFLWRQFCREQLHLRPTCEECGLHRSIDVHHLDPAHYEDLTPEKFEALCRKCHQDRHPGWNDDLSIEAPPEFPAH